MLTSKLCRAEDFRSDWVLTWERALRDDPARPTGRLAFLDRKLWEWCAIARALEEHDMLRPGRRGCGFAVGREPLASAFAVRGVSVLATDGPEAAEHWGPSGEHAASLDAVFNPGIIDRAAFDARVRHQMVDMRDLGALPDGGFDFLWSSCALEHLGSLEAGLEFVRAAMRLLRPGGVAVHTTEFNISSDTATVERGDNVLYRRRDIEALAFRVRFEGAALLPPDFDPGHEPDDLAFDVAPYYSHGRPHMKLLLNGYVATSMLLVLQQGVRPPMPVAPPPPPGPEPPAAPEPPSTPEPRLCLPRRVLRRCRRLFGCCAAR